MIRMHVSLIAFVVCWFVPFVNAGNARAEVTDGRSTHVGEAMFRPKVSLTGRTGCATRWRRRKPRRARAG